MIGGTLHRLDLDSAVLRDNPLGDPTRREIPVYLPPGFESGGGPGADRAQAGAAGGLPLIFVLAGYTGRGEGALCGTPWDPSFPERYERLLERGEAEPAAFVFPDAFTRLGGSQYMNSSATGRYRDYLVDEILPRVEERFGVGGRRERRGLMGKSSGGYGALHLSFERPDLFSALASHSGDAAFDLCYRGDFAHLLAALDTHGDLPAFLAAFDAAPRKTTPLILGMSMVAMAAAYSPDPGEPLGIALPVEARTGRLREDVWARWLAHDPVERAHSEGQRLVDFRLVFIDAGRRDEYHLQYGARQLVDTLRKKGVTVHHEEFDDGHRGISYRYDHSLPLLTRALSA